MNRKARIYKGVCIFPCTHVYGWRWTAKGMYSSTLAGIKSMINTRRESNEH
jgi:hypothetical protein